MNIQRIKEELVKRNSCILTSFSTRVTDEDSCRCVVCVHETIAVLFSRLSIRYIIYLSIPQLIVFSLLATEVNSCNEYTIDGFL